MLNLSEYARLSRSIDVEAALRNMSEQVAKQVHATAPDTDLDYAADLVHSFVKELFTAEEKVA
jgi:hypothetical protein